MTPTPPKLSELSTEERRILVAEACGFCLSRCDTPDFDNDLAACHAFEQMHYAALNKGRYWQALRKHLSINTKIPTSFQRVSQFLLTKNLATL